MTVSELYEMCDDASERTTIAVYDNRSGGRFVDYNVIFDGIFNDMSISVRQAAVVKFSYSHLQDTLFVII